MFFFENMQLFEDIIRAMENYDKFIKCLSDLSTRWRFFFIFVRTEEQIEELKAKTDSLIDEDCLDWIIPQVSLLLGAIQGLVLNLIAKLCV